MPDYDRYHLTISTLTPLHIGSGEVLLNGYDYAVHRGKTWRIDFPAWLDQQTIHDPAYAEQLAAQPPASLMDESDFEPGSPYFRYVVAGTPFPLEQGNQVREQIKDWQDQPYLPGSSLKGALRTSLAWYLWKAKNVHPDISQLGRKRQWAAQEFERNLFGLNPNQDFMRALIVSDSQPIPPDRLILLNVKVVNRGGKLGTPIRMEAVRSDSTFEVEAKLDWPLFSDWARAHGLKLEGKSALSALPAIVNAHSQERIQSEAQWYRQIPGADRLAGFYDQLLKSSLAENQFILQLGWGTGWTDKTFGTRLQEDGRFMERIIQDFDLARGKHKPGQPFPTSRRVAISFKKDASGKIVQETPAMPLGWVLVTFEPVRGSDAWTQKNEVAIPQAAQPKKPSQPAPVNPIPPPTKPADPVAAQPATRPQPIPPAEPVERRPVLQAFTKPPESGDRFVGKVFDVSDQVYIELPGLDADVYTAVIPLQEFGKQRPKEGTKLRCEVVSVEADPANRGGWLVGCLPL